MARGSVSLPNLSSNSAKSFVGQDILLTRFSRKILTQVFQLSYTALSRLKLFQVVVHVYEPRSEQSFFINAPLLLAKLSPASWPVFVSTDDSPNILAEPPEDIPSLVQNLANQLLDRSSWNDASAIVLPDNLSVTSTVPLAALLLEYPVAYCPGTIATGPYLSHVTLDVYEVYVQLLDNEDKALVQQQTWIPPSDILNRRHSILKFSCPSVLGISFPERLSPELLMGQLRSRFNSRITSEIAATVIVHHSIETLDRVAL
jgi:hypothetical protein